MGFNDEHARRWICFDLETCPREDIEGFIPTPEAARNLKDPVKIAADLEEKRAEQLAKLGLDWNLNRIVAIGWQTELMTSPYVAITSLVEWMLLDKFWHEARGRRLIGFNARTFDVPVLIQRSRLLGVSYRSVNLARFGRGEVTDLSDMLTFDDAPCTYVMKRTLTNFCKLFGVTTPDDPVEGKDIAALVQAGEWDAVRHHVKVDVLKTVGLARKLGVIPAVVETAGVF
jgi:predicted PolB exonuclease-like 3'-5' exonuclease